MRKLTPPRSPIATDCDTQRPGTPARALYLAIVATAIYDLDDCRPSALGARMKAQAWVMGAPAPITFAMACSALGINDMAARAALLPASKEVSCAPGS